MIWLCLTTLASANTLDFDSVVVPSIFEQTQHTTDMFASQGVVFQGPGGNDGWGVLQHSSFGVIDPSGANFLAWNSADPAAVYTDGGIPIGPETIVFTPAADGVSFRVGGASDGTITAEAFDTGGASLGTATSPIPSTLADVSLPFIGIKTVVVTATCTSSSCYGGIDDLVWDEGEADADTDADTDSDTDADTDADSDADSDPPDTGIDTDPPDTSDTGEPDSAETGDPDLTIISVEGGCGCTQGRTGGGLLLIAGLLALRRRR